MKYLVYFVIFLFCFILAIIADLFKRKESYTLYYVFSVFCLLFLSIFAGCRDFSVGYDVTFYGYDYFKAAHFSSSYFEYLRNVDSEWFYLLINYISSAFSDSFNVALGCISFVTMSFYYFASAKLYKKIYFPLLFFCILLYQYMTSMNILRQSIAAAIMFYSYMLIDEQKKFGGWKFICVSIMGILSHITAVLPFAFLVYGQYSSLLPDNKKKRNMCVAVVGAVSIVVGLSILLSILSSIPGFERYATYGVSNGNEVWRTPIFPKAAFVFTLLNAVVLYISYKRNIISLADMVPYVVMIIYSVCVAFLCRYTGSMQRLLYYSMPIMTAMLLKLICNTELITKRTKCLLQFGVLLFFIMYYVVFFEKTLAYHSEYLGI